MKQRATQTLCDTTLMLCNHCRMLSRLLSMFYRLSIGSVTLH